MNRARRRQLTKLFKADPTHGGVVPPECRGTPSGKPDAYDPDKRRIFDMADCSQLWVDNRTIRLTHGPTGLSAEGEGDSEGEALIDAGTILEARLVFVRLEREAGFVLRAA